MAHIPILRLLFKTNGGQNMSADFDRDATVETVKSTVLERLGIVVPVRLIYNGRLLRDANTLAQSGVSSGGMIVVYSQGGHVRSPPRRRPNVSPIPIPQPAFPDPPGFREKVMKLTELGFSAGDCELALRAAVGNVDRAAEFILSGHIPEPPQTISTREVPVVAEQACDEEEDCGDCEEELTEEQLRRRLTRLRDRMIHDPAALRHFLEDMAAANPCMGGIIRSDPASFLASIGLNPDDFDLSGLGRTTQYDLLMEQFSPDERAIIERLADRVGVDSSLVMQVFAACGRDAQKTEECLNEMKQ